MTTLSILGLLGTGLLVSILWCTWAFQEKYGRPGGQVFSVFTIIGFVATMITVSITIDENVVYVELNNLEVTKMDRMVIIDDGDDFYKLTGYENVNKINDSTKFFVMKTTNIWGYEGFEDRITLLGDTTTIDGYVRLYKVSNAK